MSKKIALATKFLHELNIQEAIFLSFRLVDFLIKGLDLAGPHPPTVWKSPNFCDIFLTLPLEQCENVSLSQDQR